MKKILFVLFVCISYFIADPLTARESVDDNDIVGRSGWMFIEDDAFVDNVDIEQSTDKVITIESNESVEDIEEATFTNDEPLDPSEVSKAIEKMEEKTDNNPNVKDLFDFETKDSECQSMKKKGHGCKSSR